MEFVLVHVIEVSVSECPCGIHIREGFSVGSVLVC